jgi:hypothetical protein
MALQDWSLEEALNHLNSNYKIEIAPGGIISWTTPQNNFDYFDDGNSPEISGLTPISTAQRTAIE